MTKTFASTLAEIESTLTRFNTLLDQLPARCAAGQEVLSSPEEKDGFAKAAFSHVRSSLKQYGLANLDSLVTRLKEDVTEDSLHNKYFDSVRTNEALIAYLDADRDDELDTIEDKIYDCVPEDKVRVSQSFRQLYRDVKNIGFVYANLKVVEDTASGDIVVVQTNPVDIVVARVTRNSEMIFSESAPKSALSRKKITTLFTAYFARDMILCAMSLSASAIQEFVENPTLRVPHINMPALVDKSLDDIFS